MKILDKYMEEIIHHLKLSNESVFADETPEELIKVINTNKNNIDKIKVLFLPTTPLQDIAIDNGWGNKFNEIASKIDKLA
jgi:hypothetical protein